MMMMSSMNLRMRKRRSTELSQSSTSNTLLAAILSR
jgi:hypothetical protein